MALNLGFFLIQIIVSTIIIAPPLWIAGKMIVGGEKAKFGDAVWIVALGSVIGSILGVLFTSSISGIIQLIIWLYLVKTYFDTGWLKAFIISFFSVIIYIVIAFILTLLGFGLFQLL
jgi:hypothetical protein